MKGKENGITTRQSKSPHEEPTQKVFMRRNSLLTDLIDTNPHIKTVYHIFVASLICLFVNTVAHDYFRQGKTQFGIHLIHQAFGKLHVVIIHWIAAFALTLLSYRLFRLWANVRIDLSPKVFKLWDTAAITFLIGYYVSSLHIATIVVTKFWLPPASSGIVVIEQVRFIMKVHSFVRTNAEKVVKYKTHSDQALELPSISKFLYFMFAPTLIYKDDYPRSPSIRWTFVFSRLCEIAAILFYQSFLFHRFILPPFEDFGRRKYNWAEIISLVCDSSVPGLLLYATGFYLILHSIQNLFAELLRFGDRLFYREWWTCTSYADYFRRWNIVVYDWLYSYIYKDTHYLLGCKNVAKLTVLLVSGVIHEWALSCMFGFFYPLLFIEFVGAAGILSFVKIPKLAAINVLFWYGLIFGSGSLVSLYSLEYYANLNVPPEDNFWRGHLLPRWLTCDCIESR